MANMNKNAALLVIGVLLAGQVLAQESVPEWKGEAAIGFVMTSGNTETQSATLKSKAVNERAKWRHSAELDALNTEDHDVTTAERYLLAGQTNYKFRPRHYIFGLVSYEDDRFSGFDWRASEVVGYGYRAIERADLTLDLEVGPGARQSMPDVGDRKSEGMVRLAGNLDWKVSETTNFTEVLTSEIGEDVTISKSVTGLKTQINNTLSMKLAYTVKHTSEVPAGIEKVDRETAVMLVYGF